MDAEAAKADNPFLTVENWTTPHGAVPFDRIEKRHFVPALEASIAEAKARVAAIKDNPETPNFDNAILALETAGERMRMVELAFWNLFGAESDDELQALAKDVAPMSAAYSSDVLLDADLFAKIKAVYDRRAELNVGVEEKRLIEKTYKAFARNGALLPPDKKEKLRALDQEMSQLGPQYSENLLKATNAFRLVVENEEDLAGLPEAAVEAAAEEAKAAGEEGKWAFTLQMPSYRALIMYADKRDLREKIWRAYSARAFGGEHDNREICKKIARLRHDRAKLLGHATHAEFVLEERMAENPARVAGFMERFIEVAGPAARKDVEAVRALATEMGLKDELQPWDYAYYSEKLKQRDYALDDEQLRPYFKLENVIEGAFEHAKRLFGLAFKPIEGVPVYHPDVKAYEVRREDDGAFMGLLYADFFPRKGKRNGAWMTNYREQGLQFGEVRRPLVSIVCNFTKPTASKPSLLTHEEVRTLFHEFGHALHSLLSACRYVSLAGTNVYWDFVELPSQIMENWTLEKEALDLFARHWKTGEPIPAELAERIKKAAAFQAGYATMRQVQFGMLDMAWHASDPYKIDDVADFETAATARTRVFEPVEGANVSCGFSHIFDGGYSAGYYSYKWAEVLEADAFEAFLEKGLFDRDTGRRFRDAILARGDSEHPMELYKAFRGREPDPDALFRREGLM